MEATAATLERRVRVIPATRKPEELHRDHDGKMRVAAYCRVSTDSEEQLNSYEAQKTYYTQKIQDSPDWEMAGIYADEGISGTSLKKRTQFNKMITACKRGHIDLIITKSLSRFARNTVDLLQNVRKLKSLQTALECTSRRKTSTPSRNPANFSSPCSAASPRRNPSLSARMSHGESRRARRRERSPSSTRRCWDTGRGRTDSRRSYRRKPRSSAAFTTGIWAAAPWDRSSGSWRRTVFPPHRV